MNGPQDKFLKAADYIGARLCRDAIWAGERCNWLGDSMEHISDTWSIVHRALGPELYGGTSGIAFFLGQLFDVTREKIFGITAKGAIRQAISKLADFDSTASAGFYSGQTGVAYVLFRLGEIFDDQEFIEQGLQVLQSLAEQDVKRQGLDVISGSAGAIPVLLDIQHRYPHEFILSLALKHGVHLLDTAQKNQHGWSWDTLSGQVYKNLTGFSHGAAGISWALLELYRETKQDRFLAAAEQGFMYERHWFNTQYQNWPDLRGRPDSQGNFPCSIAWCHGAPGIGLSRLRAYRLLGDNTCLTEAEAAIRTTAVSLKQSANTVSDFSLCHGMSGNAELMIYASEVLSDQEYKALADEIGGKGVEHWINNNKPWSCGVPGGGETPNLMLGIAGIGYFYLRLYDPMKMRSILIVSPD
jgi:type 2 lantibiotic biosynthesis protein LanM